MRVVYSDESGLGSEREEPLTVVAGLILDIDSQWHPVLESIETALAACVGEKKVPTYEIRGRVLYHKIKNGEPEAAKLMASLMSIPSQHRIPVFFGAIDRTGYKYFRQKIFNPVVRGREGQDDPIGPDETFRKALMECIGIVDAYVHDVFPTEQVLWIHDKGRYEEDAKGHLKYMRNLAGDDFMRELKRRSMEVPAYPAQSHIIDTIYFGNSHESRALQLADVCCATITRHLHGDPTATPYYELLSTHVIRGDARPEYEDSERIWLEGLEQEAKKKPDRSKG